MQNVNIYYIVNEYCIYNVKLFQKLLWAVSEVLKSCGIDSHHKQFRSFLQQLFKVCSKQWLQQPKTEIKTSTSEAMRTLVMKHKSTVLKLKVESPKNSTKNNDNVISKPKSVADVKKVLFTDISPKSGLKAKTFESELKMKNAPIKTIVISDNIANFEVFLDASNLPSTKHSVDQSNRLVSSISDYCSDLDIDSKD